MQEEEEVEEKGQEENDTSFFGWPPAPDLLVPLLLVLVLLLLTILLAWLLHRLVHLKYIVAENMIHIRRKRRSGKLEEGRKAAPQPHPVHFCEFCHCKSLTTQWQCRNENSSSLNISD